MAISYKNDVPMVGQPNTKTCWLGCYQMLYGWRRLNIGAPAQKVQNAGISSQKELYPAQFCSARNAVGLTSYRASYLKESPDNLMYTLQKHGPMWSTGFFLGGSAHAILIVGMTNSGWLSVFDPYELYFYHSESGWTYENWKKLAFDFPCSQQVWF